MTQERKQHRAASDRSQSRPCRARSRKSTAREYFESIVIAVILALFIRTFVVQAFKIPTGSMENNLLIGDHLLVNKFVFGPTASGLERALLPMGTIHRGDVVVFKYPEEPERDFIKRVIGLPGETIELRTKKVYVNGTPLDEPYVHFLEPPGSRDRSSREVTSLDVRERYGPVTVPGQSVLRDGRQPRQLAGQPLLGLPAARLRQGQGAHHLLVLRVRAAKTTRRRAPRTRSRAWGRCSRTSSRARAGIGCCIRYAELQSSGFRVQGRLQISDWNFSSGVG